MNQSQLRKILFVTRRIARQQRIARSLCVRTDQKIGQHAGLDALAQAEFANYPVFQYARAGDADSQTGKYSKKRNNSTLNARSDKG